MIILNVPKKILTFKFLTQTKCIDITQRNTQMRIYVKKKNKNNASKTKTERTLMNQ